MGFGTVYVDPRVDFVLNPLSLSLMRQTIKENSVVYDKISENDDVLVHKIKTKFKCLFIRRRRRILVPNRMCNNHQIHKHNLCSTISLRFPVSHSLKISTETMRQKANNQ